MKKINLPRVPLGFLETPLVKLERLSQTLGGPNIYIKRDDQTGLAFGGNKTRKLEFILGEAQAKGADTLITAGAAQSNHCRQTAAAAAKLGLACHLVLGGIKPTKANGNLLLDQLFGCHIHFSGDNRKGEDIPALYEQLKSEGKRPFIVPYGGSNELGAAAFAQAMIELKAQQTVEFSNIIFASSSGGTHAGMLVGKALTDSNSNIIGINIDKAGMGDLTLSQYIVELCQKTADKIGLKHHFDSKDIILNHDYVGAGYGVLGKAEREAISLMAKTEGILLDPVYTGKAMGALIDMVRKGRYKSDENILFWHTGGTPALFAYSDDLYQTE